MQSSQDTRFSFSPKVEAQKVVPSASEEDGEVEFIGKTVNSIMDYPHHRFLCIKYPFGTNTHKHCVNCFCVVCEERASECKDWYAHSSISKREYKEMLCLQTRKEKQMALDPAVGVALSNDAEHEVAFGKILDSEEQVNWLESSGQILDLEEKIVKLEDEKIKLSDQILCLKEQKKKLDDEKKYSQRSFG